MSRRESNVQTAFKGRRSLARACAFAVAIRPAGIEPATCGLEVQADSSAALRASFEDRPCASADPAISTKDGRVGNDLRDSSRDTEAAPVLGSDQRRRDTEQLNARQICSSVIDHVLQSGVTLSCDEFERTFIEFPGEHSPRRRVLRSRRVRAWLSSEAKKIGIVIWDRELNAIMNVLEGLALESQCLQVCDSHLWDEVERNPVVEALTIWMDGKSTWEGRMSDLLTRLKDVVIEHRGKAVTDRLTATEFRRLLEHVDEIVGKEAAPSWRHFIDGLWLSGLRIGESLELFWDDDSKLRVVYVDGDTLLRIPADLEKGHKDRLLALAPDFVAFLERTPPEERVGRVFKLKALKVHGERLTTDRVTRIVSAIGKAAGIVVDNAKMKYASAHDLRRSFGERWALLLTPVVLKELMRHESIQTTMRYYVGEDAKRTSRVVRDAHKNSQVRDTSRDTSQEKAEAAHPPETKPDVK